MYVCIHTYIHTYTYVLSPSHFLGTAGADFLLSVTAASGRTIEAIPYSQISVGSRVFTDRDYSFNSIGDYSARTFYIRGPNDDKDTPAASPQWTITVNVPVIVYLDFYDGQETMGFAQWNHGWKVSSMSSMSLWLNSNHQEGPGVVYEKYFAAGEISLYGNDGAHQGTYLAFVARAHGGNTTNTEIRILTLILKHAKTHFWRTHCWRTHFWKTHC